MPLAPHTTLIVDDEAAVRVATARLLRVSGFGAIPVSSTGAALHDLTSPLPGKFPAAIGTNLMMRIVTGSQLADEVSVRWPGLPVMFISAHADHPLLRREVIDRGRRFLPKPFAVDASSKHTSTGSANTRCMG